MDGLFLYLRAHHGDIFADLGMKRLQKPIKQKWIWNICSDLCPSSLPLMDVIGDVCGIALLGRG